MTIYKTSRDYDRLYQLICDGHEVLGWVDYDYICHGESRVARYSVCIKRDGYLKIQASVWGKCFFAILPHDIQDWCNEEGLNELGLLTMKCKEVDLEYIEPHNRALYWAPPSGKE